MLVDVELCAAQPHVRYARGTAPLPAQVLGAYCLVEVAESPDADARFGEISQSDAIPLVISDR